MNLIALATLTTIIKIEFCALSNLYYWGRSYFWNEQYIWDLSFKNISLPFSQVNFLKFPVMGYDDIF
jgi:hypothetical protein